MESSTPPIQSTNTASQSQDEEPSATDHPDDIPSLAMFQTVDGIKSIREGDPDRYVLATTCWLNRVHAKSKVRIEAQYNKENVMIGYHCTAARSSPLCQYTTDLVRERWLQITSQTTNDVIALSQTAQESGTKIKDARIKKFVGQRPKKGAALPVQATEPVPQKATEMVTEKAKDDVSTKELLHIIAHQHQQLLDTLKDQQKTTAPSKIEEKASAEHEDSTDAPVVKLSKSARYRKRKALRAQASEKKDLSLEKSTPVDKPRETKSNVIRGNKSQMYDQPRQPKAYGKSIQQRVSHPRPFFTRPPRPQLQWSMPQVPRYHQENSYPEPASSMDRSYAGYYSGCAPTLAAPQYDYYAGQPHQAQPSYTGTGTPYYNGPQNRVYQGYPH